MRRDELARFIVALLDELQPSAFHKHLFSIDARLSVLKRRIFAKKNPSKNPFLTLGGESDRHWFDGCVSVDLGVAGSTLADG